jgi:hypothetical protein
MATKQSSAREARQIKSQSCGNLRFFCTPAGARLDCFASLVITEKKGRAPSERARFHILNAACAYQ